MTDRELLPLADGSRWLWQASEGSTVEDARGNIIVAVGSAVTVNASAVKAEDLRALLHRAGLLDELLKRAWDDGYSSGRADGLNDEIELTPNPYGKAVSDGE